MFSHGVIGALLLRVWAHGLSRTHTGDLDTLSDRHCAGFTLRRISLCNCVSRVDGIPASADSPLKRDLTALAATAA
jgi:hypothetical protein